jgi:hypothetical protein
MFAILEHLHAIYEDVDHASRVLVRFLVRCVVADGLGIKHDYVGKVISLESAALTQLESLGGK